MTARGAVSRQKKRGQGAYINLRAVIPVLFMFTYPMTGFPPDPVILVTLVITAIDCDD